ncbi:MAG: T9SS type A sorting domain-containing protein [Roseivirga sp.]|nr:T9SS type A sorting domain-containing protein [Roseivirga sp.]
MMKYWRRRTLVLMLYAIFFDLSGQQAQLVSALINGCGANDGLSEFLVVYSGGTEITNVQASDIDVRYGTVSAATATGVTDSYVSNATFITSLNNLLPMSCDFSFAGVTLGVTDIPAGSHILILNDGVTTAIDFDGWCGLGLGTVYVMFSDDLTWTDVGTFANGPSSDRFFRSVINGTTTDFDYSDQWATGDGNYAQWNDGGGTAVIYSNYTNCTPTNTDALPVSLISFTAREINGHTELRWETADELNNSHFTIYKSQDGTQWYELDLVAGYGTTEEKQVYVYRDINPYRGRTYYRLKQTDFNGVFEFFEVISVLVETVGEAPEVFPNPTSDILNIHSREVIERISFVSSTGAVYTVPDAANQSVISRYSITHLPSGVYTILIHSSEQVFRKKILKVE